MFCIDRVIDPALSLLPRLGMTQMYSILSYWILLVQSFLPIGIRSIAMGMSLAFVATASAEPTLTLPSPITVKRGDWVSVPFEATNDTGGFLNFSVGGPLPLGIAPSISGGYILFGTIEPDAPIGVQDTTITASVWFVDPPPDPVVADFPITVVEDAEAPMIHFRSISLSGGRSMTLEPGERTGANSDFLVGFASTEVLLDLQPEDFVVTNGSIVSEIIEGSYSSSSPPPIYSRAPRRVYYFTIRGLEAGPVTVSTPANGFTDYSGNGNAVALDASYYYFVDPPANEPPAVTDLGVQPIAVGEPVNLTVPVTDADGDPLAFAALNLPSGLSFDATSGVISGAFGEVGYRSMSVRVSDGQDHVTAFLRWQVADAPQLPRINAFASSAPVIDAGQSSTLSWNVDDGGEVITSLTIDQGVGDVIGTNLVEVTPAATTTYTLTASNVAGSDSASVTITVNPVVGEDALGEVTFPSMVTSPSVVTLEVPYEASDERLLSIRLHDGENGWATIGQADVSVGPGAGTHVFDLPILARAREGSGYVWALRLLPTDAASADDAFSQAYGDATVVADGGTGEPTEDLLGSVGFPSTVESPGTVTLTVPYEATLQRELRVWLHDAQNNWATLGQGSVVVGPGIGSHTFDISMLANGRIGSGYVWALRLLPIDWSSADDALDARYGEAAVEMGTGSGATQNVLTNVQAPSVVIQGENVSVRMDYETTARRDLGIWLHDAADNWRLIGQGMTKVGPGFGSEEFIVAIAPDARLGADHLWAIRLLPENWSTSDDALAASYQDVTVEASSQDLINYAVLPEATATQSSVYGSAFVADLARDGSRDGSWNNGSVTHTELNVNAWWEIDLGEEREISHLQVWNRTDCCGDRLGNYHALVSSVPFESTDLSASTSQPGVFSQQFTAAPSPAQRVDVARSGRYVRIQLSGSNYLSLAEVEVLGVPATTAFVRARQESFSSAAVITEGNVSVTPLPLRPLPVIDRVQPHDNVDGDLLDQTAEYALGTNPYDAVMSDLGLHLEPSEDGTSFDVWYERPARLDEVSYMLETSDDLEDWLQISDPEVSLASYVTEHVRYRQLEQQEGVSLERGFVRLRIRHHEWNYETTTPVLGWYHTMIRPGYQTHGLSLNRAPFLAGSIAKVDDERLILSTDGVESPLGAGTPSYVEITSGPYEGHRLNVDRDRSTDQELVIEWKALHNTLTAWPVDEGLVGATVVVREHWTLGTAYPKDDFIGSSDLANADTIQIFRDGSYDGYFLLKAGDHHQWTATNDLQLEAADNVIIHPGVGCFFHRAVQSGESSMLVTGHLRQGAFIQPLSEGFNLIAASTPMDRTPKERVLEIENGFLGSAEPLEADQIQIWAGDRDEGSQIFENYFLLDGGSHDTRFWTPMESDELESVNEWKLFPGNRAFFLKIAHEDHLNYRLP